MFWSGATIGLKVNLTSSYSGQMIWWSTVSWFLISFCKQCSAEFQLILCDTCSEEDQIVCMCACARFVIKYTSIYSLFTWSPISNTCLGLLPDHCKGKSSLRYFNTLRYDLVVNINWCYFLTKDGFFSCLSLVLCNMPLLYLSKIFPLFNKKPFENPSREGVSLLLSNKA